MIKTKRPLVKKNTHEVFESSSYLKVIDDINTNIQGNAGLIVLTGEPGSGKTLIAKKVLKDLEAENHTVFLLNPLFNIDEMLNSIYEKTGVTSIDMQNNLDVEQKLKVFYEFLKERSQKKGPVSVFIDDAQDIDTNALSNFLKLLKWQSAVKKTLQVILIGSPKLKTLLSSTEIAELKIPAPVFLQNEPLNSDEVSAFVRQRLIAFGIEDDDFFPDDTIAKMASYTRGIPGLTAILFDSVMAIMNSSEQSEATTNIVDEAVDTFSLSWATDNKSYQSIQTDEYPKKLDTDSSKLMSSSTNDKNGNKKTLISEIRGRVTELFSQHKIAGNESAINNLMHNKNVAYEREVFEALAKKPRDSKPLEDNDTISIVEKESETLANNLKFLKQDKRGNLVGIDDKKLNFLSEQQLLQNLDENDRKFELKTESFKDFLDKPDHQIVDKQSEMNTQPSKQQIKQAGTMNRGEHLNKVLKALQSGSPDVEAVALISEDGLMVANALPQDLDEIRVGGMSATLLSLGTRSSAELRRGKVKEIIVRGEEGYTVMLNAGRGTLLLVVANENAKLGLIFFDMHETIAKIAEIL